jgi:hypothetical protein
MLHKISLLYWEGDNSIIGFCKDNPAALKAATNLYRNQYREYCTDEKGFNENLYESDESFLIFLEEEKCPHLELRVFTEIIQEMISINKWKSTLQDIIVDEHGGWIVQIYKIKPDNLQDIEDLKEQLE